MTSIAKPVGGLLLLSLALMQSACVSSRVQLDPSATRWEETINEFAAQDRQDLPPKGAMLLVGSSSFRMWKTAAEDFPERRVINRGFGGSQMSDLLYYTDPLVIKYKPADVLVYEGDNDVGAGESPGTIFREFREFSRIVLRELPAANVYFVSIKPSPKRAELLETMREANALIAEFCESRDRVHYIDVFTPMLNDEGNPREELFIEDRLHMNAVGYALWTKVVRRAMNFPEPLIAGAGGD